VQENRFIFQLSTLFSVYRQGMDLSGSDQYLYFKIKDNYRQVNDPVVQDYGVIYFIPFEVSWLFRIFL